SDRETALDLPQIRQVLLDANSVGRADGALQIGETLGDRVQDAALLRAPRRPCLGRAAVAEQALEHDLWIDLHRQRPCRGLPRDRIRVYAAIALAAAARVRAGILDGELQRWKQRMATDVSGDDLVYRAPRFN